MTSQGFKQNEIIYLKNKPCEPIFSKEVTLQF